MMKSLKLSPKLRNSIFIASGSTHPTLADDIAAFMGLKLGLVERKQFPNTEQYVRYGESVRGKHVFVIQALAVANGRSVNDSLMELMLMIDAAKRSSAAEITVVTPYMAYSRQDRKARGREPISAATVIRMLQSAGADRLVSIDMHSAQTQATFYGPFDHLTAEPLLREALEVRVATSDEVFVVVSPDGGRAKLAEHYAEKLGVDVVHMPKSRDVKDSHKITRPDFIHEVSGRTCLLIDDMIDTAGTLVSAAQALKDSGAGRIIVGATHALFSGPALERLRNASIDEVIVTDTVPLNGANEVLGDKLVVLSSAPFIGRALGEIATDGSVSKMFNDHNNR
jgi:ribose-phosphate pyrophosphokinase